MAAVPAEIARLEDCEETSGVAGVHPCRGSQWRRPRPPSPAPSARAPPAPSPLLLLPPPRAVADCELRQMRSRDRAGCKLHPGPQDCATVPPPRRIWRRSHPAHARTRTHAHATPAPKPTPRPARRLTCGMPGRRRGGAPAGQRPARTGRPEPQRAARTARPYTRAVRLAVLTARHPPPLRRLSRGQAVGRRRRS